MTAPVVPAQRKRVGRPALTSRDTILAAARRIGFAELTVGQVTAAVGVKYSTFYRHFPTLASLVSAMVDDVLAEVEWPADGEWAARLSGTGVALRDVCASHPGLADAIRARGVLPPPLDVLVDGAGAGRFGSAAPVLVDATLALALAGVEDRGFGLLLDGAHVQAGAR